MSRVSFATDIKDVCLVCDDQESPDPSSDLWVLVDGHPYVGTCSDESHAAEAVQFAIAWHAESVSNGDELPRLTQHHDPYSREEAEDG